MDVKVRRFMENTYKRLPSRVAHEKFYVGLTIIVLLVVTNFVILLNGSYTISDLPKDRHVSMAKALYSDGDHMNPRFQRARSWLDTDYYDPDLLQEFGAFKNFKKYDPRLATAIWLNLINENLQDSEELLPQDFKLPFTWNMIIDLSSQLLSHPYYEKIIKAKLTCKEFGQLDPTILNKYKDGQLPSCIDYNYDEPNFSNPYDLPFKLTGSDNLYLEDLNIRKIYSIIHCLTGLPIPSKVLFLGAIDNMALKKSLIVPLAEVQDTHHNLRTNEIKHSALKSFSNAYIEKQLQKGENLKDVLRNGLSTYKELNEMNEFIVDHGEASKVLSHDVADPVARNKPMVIGKGESSDRNELAYAGIEYFEWDIDKELGILKTQIDKGGADNMTLLHLERLLLDKKDNVVRREPRYWGLASSKADRLDHFDERFYRLNVKKEDPDLHMAVLHRLTRVWFKLCHEFQIPTWLNHGPLIGWYWNGMNLNYDSDIDVQLPIQSLNKLAKAINDTLIYDFINENEYVNDEFKIDNNAELGYRSFYFEVADSFVSRTNLLSVGNNIDARLIDTQTGVYIDITALASFTSHTSGDLGTQIKILNRMRKAQISRFVVPQYYDQFYNGITLRSDIRQVTGSKTWDKIINKSKELLNDYINELGSKQEILSNYVHDRNYHFYDVAELNPLIPTYFENYNAYLPSNFLKNLLVEYGDKQVFLRPYFSTFKFYENMKIWVSHDECPVYQIADGKLIFTMNEKAMNEKCYEMNDRVKDMTKKLNPFLEFHQEEFHNLLGGGSQNQTILKQLALKNRNLDYESHKDYLKDHASHILIPEPYVVDMFN